MVEETAGGDEVVGREPCPQCGSTDNVAVYADGHRHCFGFNNGTACGYHTAGSEGPQTKTSRPASDIDGLIDFEPCALEKRKLSEETCRKFGYGLGEYRGRPTQVATYYDKDGNPCAQKLRFAGKDFMVLGEPKRALLFGQQLWSAGGKSVVITEGELDALSMSQAWDNKWPVVSIPSGVAGAAKAIRQNIEWLESFERVVFMFDNDEPGRAAAAECAALLSPGKARIAHLPLKDASDMLVAKRAGELVRAFWDAKVYRPDGVLTGEEVLTRIKAFEVPVGKPYPFAGLTSMTYGLRLGEVVIVCAGTGIGKTLFCREIEAELLKSGEKVGIIGLEEQVEEGALLLTSVFANRRLDLPENAASPEEIAEIWEANKLTENVVFYDHFGTIDVNVIAAKIRYMNKALGVQWIFLDHISIMVSGDEQDERRNLDMSLTKLKTLAIELNIGMVIVCHLKRPNGKAHEDGARVSLGHLRGSGGIAQLGNIVLALERNQQDEEYKNFSQVRVLKSRKVGNTGVAGCLEYHPKTGRLLESGINLDEVGALHDEEV